MTKQELLEALRAATGPSRELDAEIALLQGWKFETRGKSGVYWRELFPGGKYIRAGLPTYTNSIDAANAFREQMLPGWAWQVGSSSLGGYAAVAPDQDAETIGAECATPAIALCAAVIAALIAQET